MDPAEYRQQDIEDAVVISERMKSMNQSTRTYEEIEADRIRINSVMQSTEAKTSDKIPGLENMPEMTQEQIVEAHAARFEHAGFTPEMVRRMATRIKTKIRTDSTKPTFNRTKARAKSKMARRARRKTK